MANTTPSISRPTAQDWTVSEHNQSTLVKASMELPLFIAGSYIHMVWLPIIVILGIVGNILVVAVMLKRSQRSLSCSLYLAALAIADTTALLRKAVDLVILASKIRYTHAACRILVYIALSAVQYGTILVFCITIDRLIAVRFPHLAGKFCNPRRAKMLIIGLLVVIALINIPHLILTQTIGDGSNCAALCGHTSGALIYAWVQTVINLLIPLVVICVMTSIIISTVRSSRQKEDTVKERSAGPSVTYIFTDALNVIVVTKPLWSFGVGNLIQNDAGGNSQSKHQEKQGNKTVQVTCERRGSLLRHRRERQLIAMLLLVVIMFVLLTTPQYIRYIYFSYIDRWQSPEVYANYFFVYHLSNKLIFTNCAVNFYLYMIASALFRKDIRQLFSCHKKQNHAHIQQTKLSNGAITRTLPTPLACSVEGNTSVSVVVMETPDGKTSSV